jgi:4-amino-4-deoxy-L-arabinose transferase-like glycosyltransferase
VLSKVRLAVRPPTGVRPGRPALAVVAIVTALSVFRAFAPMTYPGDLWRQSDTATIARNFAQNGMNLFYPQINWGGAGPGYVETEFPLQPWLSAALYLLTGERVVLGRLVSLAFMLIATAAFWGLVRRLLPPAAARWALVAFVVSPVFTRWGTAFMPEPTVLAFTLLALFAFCGWLQTDRWTWLAAAAAATSMAALTKPTSLHIGLVMAVWLALAAPSRLRRPSVYVAGVAALVAPALWMWHASGLYRTYGNTFGVISGGDSKWGSLALWTSAGFYLGNLRTEALFVYGVVGIPLALVGVGWLWRRRRQEAAFPFVVGGVVALVVYYFAAGRYTSTELGLHYHVFSLPYAAVVTGLGLAAAADRLRPRIPRGAFLLAVGVATLALFAEALNIFSQSLSSGFGVYERLEACAPALDVSRPGDLVVVGTDNRTRAGDVANNFQEPIVFFLADRKGWSLAADQYDPAVLDSYRQQGARYFVNPYPALLPAGSPLAGWLRADATPVRTVAANGCDIWALQPPG